MQAIMTDQERHDQIYGIKRDQPPLAMRSQRPRPIGITSAVDQWGMAVFVLYDDGTIWERDYSGKWKKLPAIPQGDA